MINVAKLVKYGTTTLQYVGATAVVASVLKQVKK